MGKVGDRGKGFKYFLSYIFPQSCILTPNPLSLKVFPGLSENIFQEDDMRVEHLKEIIKVLMESQFYFDLDLKERHRLVMHVLSVMEMKLAA